MSQRTIPYPQLSVPFEAMLKDQIIDIIIENKLTYAQAENLFSSVMDKIEKDLPIQRKPDLYCGE